MIQPNREDEYARIEAAGGKVIQWNGYRVFGVLAMSRSIGKHLFAISEGQRKLSPAINILCKYLPLKFDIRTFPFSATLLFHRAILKLVVLIHFVR